MKESVGGILAHEVVSKSAKGQSIEANRLGGGVAAVLYLYCRSHRTDGGTGVKRLEHVLYGHVRTWLTRAPGLLISYLRAPNAYGPTCSIPVLALFTSPSPFISRVYSTTLLP